MTKKSVVCIIPAASSALKDPKYFEIYKEILVDYWIKRLIIVYPLANPLIFISASSSYSSSRIKVSPVPIQKPFYGLDGIARAMKEILMLIVQDNPSEVKVVTSGGTTKMGHIVRLTGDVTSHLGWEVSYLWLAKSPGKAEIQTTVLPTLTYSNAEAYDVVLQEDIKHPVIEVKYPQGGKYVKT